MSQVLCINTGGKSDQLRARRLTSGLAVEMTHFDVDRSQPRLVSSRAIWQLLKSRRWDLVYQESTGIAGGANLIRAAVTRNQPFIVSSGDPIGGFFRVTRGPIHGSFFGAYEKLLYRRCAGFVGWTPYLTGRALQMGAKRGVTVEGAVDLDRFRPGAPAERSALKQRYGLDPGHLVCGVIGSLNWTPRQSYCYGLELIEAAKRSRRQDLAVLIVGDGTGRSLLEQRVPDRLRSRIVFTGRLAETEVSQAVNAMDIGFITQTLDELGSYRLTTKLPEYLACGVPVAMSPVPGFFDYVAPAGWPLPAFHPASPKFHARCADWLDSVDREEVAEKASLARSIAAQHFDYQIVSRRFHRFVHRLLSGA